MSDRERITERSQRAGVEVVENDGAAARWSLKRGPFCWCVIALMDPLVALIALLIRIHPARKHARG